MNIYIPGQQVKNEKSIRLDTALGNHIDNGQIFEISQFEKGQFSQIEKKWKGSVELRCPPTPRYNCHGMTFASRRTGIFNAETINKILHEDGYRKIASNSVLPGDVIIYVSVDGDFEHSGIVVSSPDKDLNVPRVVSKWGKYSEFLHWANNCPYTFENAQYYRVVHNYDQPNAK